MKFKDWFDEKLMIVDSKNELDEMKCHYIPTDIDILKKVYNAYKHTGILNIEEVHIIKNKQDKKGLYYFAAYDKYINFDNIFSYITYIKGFDIFNKLNREDIKKGFTFVMPSFPGEYKEFEKDKEYNFLLSLNPSMYDVKYIKDIELILCENISEVNTIDEEIDEFIHLFNTDEYFKYTLATNWEGFAIIGFEEMEDICKYFKRREENSEPQIISVTDEELKHILDSQSNNKNNVLLN